MKHTILIWALFGILSTYSTSMGQSGSNHSNSTEPPEAVRQSLHSNFQSITNLKWDKEDGNYEANFRQNGNEMSATFDSQGSLLETETEIPASALPENVRSYIKAHYSGDKVKEAAKTVRKDGTTIFEAEVKGKDLLFDLSGTFLKED